jgi:hypothetical protein
MGLYYGSTTKNGLECANISTKNDVCPQGIAGHWTYASLVQPRSLTHIETCLHEGTVEMIMGPSSTSISITDENPTGTIHQNQNGNNRNKEGTVIISY